MLDTSLAAVNAVRQPVDLVRSGNPPAITPAAAGQALPAGSAIIGTLPPIYPEWLGDRGFLAAHGLRFAYVAGEMARGLTTTSMVIAMARAGMMGFFGAAGLRVERLEEALALLERELGDRLPWGSNLIHSPAEPGLEDKVVDLYLRRHVRRVCASAFMGLTPALVRYSASGLSRGGDGRAVRSNHLFAKVSRPEVAGLFMSPPPAAMLDSLVSSGDLTRAEAELAAHLPLAEAITAEADSGGHTDNRPLPVLLPQMLSLRDRMVARHRYDRQIHVGAAGGLGTPAAVAGAFSMGAAYVVTGSINQGAIESGLSALGRAMLAEAGPADVAMAPSADMFEMGVKVQVVKKGTLFPMRAARLYELYRAHGSIEAIPDETRLPLERDVFRRSLQEVWQETSRYFAASAPGELARAEKDPHHKLALVCRWYLGMSSRWPIDGAEDRKADFQIWCGPAMGAFNEWVQGSFLADPGQRSVVQIALNLLEGAAVVTRAQQLRSMGVDLPAEAFSFQPRRLS